VPVAAEPARAPWYARLRHPAEPGVPAQRTLVGVLTPDFAPGVVVDLPGDRRPSGWFVAARHDADGHRVRAVHAALPHAPSLWYVELAEPDADPPAVTLVAFSDTGRPDGDVLTEAEARAAGVHGEHQVAAVRWWPEAGLVHQLYVGPEYRRRGVGSKLLHAAFGVQKARGLPDLHGDGRRTDLGEDLRRGLPAYASWRLAPLTQRLPPMTPGG
jgi:GNAT superfamily N-acetyltransferase